MNSWLVRGVLAAIVVVVAVAAGWWFFVREDNELATAPPQFVATPTSAAAATPTEAGDPGDATPGTAVSTDAQASDGYELFVLVPEHASVAGRTEAAYFADEQPARIGVPSTAKGATFDVSGQFSIGPDGLDPAVESTIVVGLASRSSDEGMRDNRVRQALQVTQFPTATFTAIALEGWAGTIPDGQEVALTLVGTMELHGVQRELTWDVLATRQGTVITALATTNFLYADFDIPVLNIGGVVSVEEDVTLQVLLIAVASS